MVNAKFQNAKFHKISVYKDITVASTDKVYTGLFITIPANSIFSITADALYYGAAAQWIGVSGSQTSVSDCYENANAGHNHACVTYSGFTDNESTILYVWAQWTRASSNRVRIMGFYSAT